MMRKTSLSTEEKIWLAACAVMSVVAWIVGFLT